MMTDRAAIRADLAAARQQAWAQNSILGAAALARCVDVHLPALLDELEAAEKRIAYLEQELIEAGEEIQAARGPQRDLMEGFER